MDLQRVAASLLVGVVALVAVGVGVTAALDPYVWPSALLGLPAGVAAGVVVGAVSYLALTARAERRRDGQASPRTLRALWVVLTAAAAFPVGVGVATAVVAGAAGVGAALLFVGLPVGVLAAVVAAFLVGRRTRGPPPDPTTP